MTSLKELREKAHISQRELARKTGIDQSLLSRYEKGERQPSKGDRLLIEAALGVSLPRPHLAPYPSAPTDPVKRREWVDARNKAIREMGR